MGEKAGEGVAHVPPRPRGRSMTSARAIIRSTSGRVAASRTKQARPGTVGLAREEHGLARVARKPRPRRAVDEMGRAACRGLALQDRDGLEAERIVRARAAPR